MRLIKTRPKISLLLPSHAYPGDRVLAEVLLDAKREAPLEVVQCTLRGTEQVLVPGNNASQRYERRLTAQSATLLKDKSIPKGRTKLSCYFDLPETLPPSHETTSGGLAAITAAVEYVVNIHCEISWWPDAKREFVLVVKQPPITVDDPGPSLHASSVSGPSGKEPHVEFSLDTSQIAAGETLRGELALSNVDYNRYKIATLALVGQEKRFRNDRALVRNDEVLRYAIQLDISKTEEGQAVPFGMKLPDDIPHTHRSVLWDLSWIFEVKLEVAWGNNLVAQVPVRVLPAGSQRKVRQRKAVPTVGSKRTAAIWQGVATAQQLDFNAQERAIEGRVDEVTIKITRAHRGADGIFLVGRLSYPSLGLSIDGGLAGSLRRIVGGGVALGVEAWDKRHYVNGREEAQVAAFAKALRKGLKHLTLADIDDEHAVFEHRDAGQTKRAIDWFATQMRLMAAAFPSALRMVPPPAVMKDAVKSWEKLAKRLGARLQPSDMSVRGRYEGAEVHIVTEWTNAGEGRRTSFRYAAPDIAAEKDALEWVDGEFTAGEPAELSKKAKSIIEAMTGDMMSLTVQRDVLVLWDVRAPLRDYRLLNERLEQLAALAAALHAHGGPYR